MGDRNINVRSITGLNPVQDIMCDRLDIVRKITIDGSEPVTIQFLGYDPATQTTKYMTTTDTQYTAGVGLTLVDNGFAFSGGDVGTIDLIIRGSLNAVGAFTATGSVFMTNLPKSDPSVSGQIWNDGGTLKVSAEEDDY